MDQGKNTELDSSWQNCHYCSLEHFKTQQDFIRHLRERHCTKEGGSFVCRYGYNGVCNSLPLDGVSDRDYESHIQRHHLTKKAIVEQWSVYSAAQNLPAVLNDPNRSKPTNLFTKTWGDHFIDISQHDVPKSYYLPDITRTHFESYLRKISKRCKKREKLLENCDNSNEYKSKNNLNDNYSDINIIPDIFLEINFKLNDPKIFNRVFTHFQSDNDLIATKLASNSRLFQEKLTHYLDIIEVKIAHQVSQKSSAFFNAMTSHDAIMEQMNNAVCEVKLLREKIKNLDKNFVEKSSKLLFLARSRNNHHKLLEKLKLMSTVLQTQPTLQLLLSAPDYVAALELISSTQDVLQRELAGVTSLRHLPSQLEEMTRLIDKMLNCEFERYAANDLHRPLNENNNEYDNKFYNLTQNCIEQQHSVDLKVTDIEKLTSLVAGLLRSNNLKFLEFYKEESVMAAQTILKQLFIEPLTDQEGDTEVCLTGSGETPLSMTPTQVLQLLNLSTSALTKLLQRVRAVHDVIKSVADMNLTSKHSSSNCSERNQEAFLTLEDYARVEIKLQDLLKEVCEYCLKRCAGIIKSTNYTERSQNISASQIVEIYKIVNNFSNVCEHLSNRNNPLLKSAFNILAERYVHKFHSQRKSNLLLILDTERWRIAEVPTEFQLLADQLKNCDFCSDVPSSPLEKSTPTQLSTTLPNYLLIDTEKIILPGVGLMLLRIIHEYCTCAKQLPIMANSLTKKLIELMQTFNSKTYNLVLGGGAIQKAGLKTITVANLALSSRVLQFILFILPYVKIHFELLNVDLKSSFDNIKKDLLNHIEKLESKIVSIVDHLLGNQLNEWQAKPPVPSKSFRSLSKDLTKLHEAIADILPEEQINKIFGAIHLSFKTHLRNQLIKMNIVNNGGPQHGVVTSELTFYNETMKNLKVLTSGELSDNCMKDIWVR